MAWDNFPFGIMSAGVPVLGGFNGIPLTGSWFFVDYQYGSDGNGVASGRTPSGGGVGGAPPNSPMKTLQAAHDLCLDGNNDVVVIMGNGSSTGTARLTATLTWTKNATHLLGMTAPVLEAQRARISTLTTATVNINPLMSVSGSGCIFSNFSFFQGVGQASTDEQLIDITGSRNYFGNVDFGGMGNAAGAARAGSYVMKLNGGGENTFDSCSIGLETVQRSAANANVVFVGGAQRNLFRNCTFAMNTSSNTALYIDASASNAFNGSTNTMRFCFFRTLLSVTSATSPSVVATVAADVNGVLYFDTCACRATDWSANTTGQVYTNCYVPNGNTGGITVVPA